MSLNMIGEVLWLEAANSTTKCHLFLVEDTKLLHVFTRETERLMEKDLPTWIQNPSEGFQTFSSASDALIPLKVQLFNTFDVRKGQSQPNF